MKQSLQQKMNQSLAMTPQLQQAIKLLQLSTIDLQAEIQQSLEENPLLEIDEEQNSSAPTAEETDIMDLSGPEKTDGNKSSDDLNVEKEMHDTDWEANLPSDLPVDAQWEDLIPASAPLPSSTEFYEQNRSEITEESLKDYLLWQLNLTRFSDCDRLIALTIIDAIDSNGRLILSLEEIHNSLDPQLEIETDEINAVLHRLHHFDPPGVFAKDLTECLLIQLQQLDKDKEWREEAITLLTRYSEQLSSSDYSQITRRMRLSKESLRKVLCLIQNLNPNPGDNFSGKDTEYIIPDVYVSCHKGRWIVELNPEIAPKLKINSVYAEMMRVSKKDSEDHAYIKENLQEAKWFIKSLESRNTTLMKVAKEIVLRQRKYLEHGEEAMQPLILGDIANAINMHESTISRVTTRKYMHTPRGIKELKYFFSSHVSTISGGECSSIAIRALIKKLVAAENSRKPLSDNRITQILNEQGIDIRRRTVAKYRDALLIAPSNERKRLI